MSEQEMIGPFVEILFASMVMFGPDQESSLVALTHESINFKVPPQNSSRDNDQGCRRGSALANPVRLCWTPRNRNDEIDGVDLEMGWLMVIYIVTKDKLGAS